MFSIQQITTFKNRIYVAGGNKDSGTPVNTVEFYDPEKNTWTSIASISSTGVVGISGLGNKLICAGNVIKYCHKFFQLILQ